MHDFKVSGEGTILSNCVILQSKSYWELKVIEPGPFCVGVSHMSSKELNIPLNTRKQSWCYTCPATKVKKDDIIGVTYDLTEVRYVLTFYLNGKEIPKSKVSGIKGDVTAAVSLSDGCILEANFGQTDFDQEAPGGFDAVVYPSDLI